MSTNHTTNYGLCQWLSTDQVQRTDFNQDNAKIDTALHTEQQTRAAAIQAEQQARAALEAELLALMPSVKLGEWSLTSAAHQLVVDLSGKDLSSFTGLRVVYDGRGCSSTVCLQVNGIGLGYRTASTHDSYSSDFYNYLTAGVYENCRSPIEIYPGEDGLCFSWDQVAYYGDRYLNVGRLYGFLPDLQLTGVEELKFFGIEDTVTLGAGSKVTIYGLRD